MNLHTAISAAGQLLIIASWIKYWRDPRTLAARQRRAIMRITGWILLFEASIIARTNGDGNGPATDTLMLISAILYGLVAVWEIVFFPEEQKGGLG